MQSPTGATSDAARLEFLLSATSAVTYSCEVRAPFGATFISDNVGALLGYTPQQFVNDPAFWASHVHPDERDAVLEGIGAIFSAGRHTHEYRFLHADGTYRWLHDDLVLVKDDAGRATEMVGVFYDVTTRVELERARQRTERRFHALIDVLPVGVWIHREGRVVYANRAMRALLRCAADGEIVGQSIFAFVPAAGHALVQERMRLLEAAPELTLNAPVEGTFLRLDGTIVTAEVEAMKLDFDGAPAVLVLARDLTERRMLLSQLAAADRLASMGTLAAGVAHEINNPLAYVLTNLSLLAETLQAIGDVPGAAPLAEKGRALARDAYEGATRVRDVVRDLRALSRRDVDEVFPVDVRQVLESCVRIASNEIKHTARLVLELGDVPLVSANATRLGQVFLNLILNATQALPDGHADANEIRVRTQRSAEGEVVVEVSDTGPGIAPEVIAHVFDPFFTTKPVGGGTGLGLSIAHGIVASMNGTITVESTLGAGTTFRVTLPAGAAAPLATPSPVGEAPSAGRRGRVLVIDDDQAVAKTLRLLIEPHHDVVAVTRAREALDLIARGETFDAIVCDLMMPDVSGMQCYEKLTQLAPAMASRVVFLTGGAFTQAAREFIQRVPNRTLEKPFEPGALLATLASIVGR